MTVDNVTVEDAGFYEAVIGNEFGHLSFTFEIKVNGESHTHTHTHNTHTHNTRICPRTLQYGAGKALMPLVIGGSSAVHSDMLGVFTEWILQKGAFTF